jgi:hypothetical protein
MLDTCGCGRTPESGAGLNEEAFRYVIAVERRRIERTGDPFLLVAIDLWSRSGSRLRFAPGLAATVFARMERRLRATDFFGWLRHPDTIGVVMTECGPRLSRGVGDVIRQTVESLIEGTAPAGAAFRVRLRVYRSHAGRAAAEAPLERVA